MSPKLIWQIVSRPQQTQLLIELKSTQFLIVRKIFEVSWINSSLLSRESRVHAAFDIFGRGPVTTDMKCCFVGFFSFSTPESTFHRVCRFSSAEKSGMRRKEELWGREWVTSMSCRYTSSVEKRMPLILKENLTKLRNA